MASNTGRTLVASLLEIEDSVICECLECAERTFKRKLNNDNCPECGSKHLERLDEDSE